METIAEELEELWAHNRAFFREAVRHVQVQRVGSHYRARYAGEANSCFGSTPKDAAARLKFWSDHGKA